MKIAGSCLLFLCSAFKLFANPVFSDSCQVMTWKSGHSIAVRILSQENFIVKYQKCSGGNEVFTVKTYDLKSIGNQEFDYFKPESFVLLHWNAGASTKIKIIKSNDHWIRFKYPDQEDLTEYLVYSEDISHISKIHEPLKAHPDSCQLIEWKNGNISEVVILEKNETEICYFKCSDTKKKVYRAKLTELEAKEVPAYYRKGRKSLAILAIIFALLPVPFSVIGVILAVIASYRKDGFKLALIALVLGAVFSFLQFFVTAVFF